ncbi:MAG: GNAT family N-acetyltransferase [Desulfurococcales archaeon]|nr:GNAT family N-acetyltransferase [Desulfurococcales archaeon]
MVVRISVREATPNDLEQVSALIARLKMLNEELDPHYKVVEGLQEIAKEYVEEKIKSEKSRVIVAVNEQTGEIAGVLVYDIVDRRFYMPRIKAVITEFYVLPRYRRKRIGTLLLEKAEELARADGAGMLTVIYPSGNTLADAFYKAKGFIDLAYEKYRSLL